RVIVPCQLPASSPTLVILVGATDAHPASRRVASTTRIARLIALGACIAVPSFAPFVMETSFPAIIQSRGRDPHGQVAGAGELRGRRRRPSGPALAGARRRGRLVSSEAWPGLGVSRAGLA